MTAQRAVWSRSRGRLGVRSFHLIDSLCGGPRTCEGRNVHQIVSDHAEADPAVHAVVTMVTTAVESMSAFQDTDAPLAADAPPLSPPEPALALVCAPRERLRATMRQHDSADAAGRRGPFVGRRAEAAITGREIGCASKDRLVAIQGGDPQGDVGWPLRVDVVCGDDLMFRLLNGDELAELVRLRNLAFPNCLGVRFEDAQHFGGDVGIAAEEACPRLVDDT